MLKKIRFQSYFNGKISGALLPSLPPEVFNEETFMHLMVVNFERFEGEKFSVSIKYNLERKKELMFGIWVHDQDDIEENRQARRNICLADLTENHISYECGQDTIVLQDSTELSSNEDLSAKIGEDFEFTFIQDPIFSQKDSIKIQIPIYDLHALDWSFDDFFSADSVLYVQIGPNESEVYIQNS